MKGKNGEEKEGDGDFAWRAVYTKYFGYNSKMEGYATLMSDIPKLDAIFWHRRIKVYDNI